MPDLAAAHWPEYFIEASLLAGFMISACTFGVLLGSPGSRVVRALPHPVARRSLMGIAMGLTAVALIDSAWGQRSGAHMNPATTLTFWTLGKVAALDAALYAIAQFVGGAAGVWIARLVLRGRLSEADVNYVVTAPGRRGASVAWFAELAIAFGMMLIVLSVSNHAILSPYTSWFAGGLVALYITFEAPLSGMSLNPARTFGSAVVACQWRAIWVYLTAPVAGMLLAALAYEQLPLGRVYCAKLNHWNQAPCPFRCEFHALREAAARVQSDPP